jgi:uncharacterized sporulation protein YeaH/YhbH (DUF444 family)
MPFIYIDRRKAGRGKSLPNRQKLIKRVKQFIKQASPQNIGNSGVSSNNNTTSPVRVTGSALEEPRFAYARGGIDTIIVIGNKEYNRGDEIQVPDAEDGSAVGQPGESGEDSFIVNVAKDEFLNLFFEDCELPNLTNEKYTEKLDKTQQPSGFSSVGSPAQLSVIRTYKQSLGRRWALMRPYKDELEELQKQLNDAEEKHKLEQTKELEDERSKLEQKIIAIKEKIYFLNSFDKSDLRFRKKEAKPLKTVDAVLIMVMDISGSMDEYKKTIARRWFALLYAFIKKRYNNTELVFIAHTDEAFEMSEDDFFTTKMNGGTKVSSALELVNSIIKSRYDCNKTNIYISHASDGDNWDEDNEVVVSQMIGEDAIMEKTQMFSYIEVGKQRLGTAGMWFSNTLTAANQNTSLWEAYDKARLKHSAKSRKMTLSIIETPDECYQVFKNVFKKDKK